jgi:hypothetical protein
LAYLARQAATSCLSRNNSADSAESGAGSPESVASLEDELREGSVVGGVPTDFPGFVGALI